MAQGPVGAGQVAVGLQLALDEVDAEDRARVDGLSLDAPAGEEVVQPGDQPVRQAVEVVEGRGRQFSQCCQAGSHGHGVGAEASALGKAGRPPAGIQQVHEVGPAAESPHRKPSPHDLSKAGQIRIDTELGLQAASAGAKADNFVENQQQPVSSGDLSHGAGEFRPNREHPRLGVEHDTGQVPGVFFDEPGDGGLVVVGKHQHLAGRVGRHPSGAGYGMGSLDRSGPVQGRKHADFHRVVAAVVAAFELGDPGLSAESSGQPNRVQGGFGAGVHEPDPVEAGDPTAHFGGHVGLDACGGAQGDSLIQLGPNGLHDLGMVVAQDLGGVVVGEVHIAVPVDVFQDAPPGSGHGQGIGLKEVGALGRSGRHRPASSKGVGRVGRAPLVFLFHRDRLLRHVGALSGFNRR